MAVQTVNGATLPAGPTPGQGGVRAYDSTDIDAARAQLRAADGALDTFNQSMNLVGAILTVVIAGATAYAGINVMSSIAGSMSLSQGDMFYNSSTALQDGINSFFTNLPTVFVVIALVLIIGYLTLLR
jgi:hypothetical protein